MFKTLFVEDERELLDSTVDYLNLSGFEARGIQNSAEALGAIEHFNPDVVLLDKMMPGVSGSEIVRQIRSHRQLASMPIIMVTGRSAEDEKIEAFDLGVDDYITKPFSLAELTARVRALCRRLNPGKVGEGLILDLSAHQVSVDGKDIALTLTEFNLLHELVSHPGEVQSRDRLRQTALHNQHVSDRTIDVHIASLRRKLMGFGRQIKTVRGIGYKVVLGQTTRPQRPLEPTL